MVARILSQHLSHHIKTYNPKPNRPLLGGSGALRKYTYNTEKPHGKPICSHYPTYEVLLTLQVYGPSRSQKIPSLRRNMPGADRAHPVANKSKTFPADVSWHPV